MKRDRTVVRRKRRQVRQHLDAQRLRNIDNEKMSKSLATSSRSASVAPAATSGGVAVFCVGRVTTGADNYSLEQLEQADSALSRIYTALA